MGLDIYGIKGFHVTNSFDVVWDIFFDGILDFYRNWLDLFCDFLFGAGDFGFRFHSKGIKANAKAIVKLRRYL